MRKITINGLQLECDDNIELSIEGDKVTIKAAPPASGTVVYHHHFQPNGIFTPVPPYSSWTSIGQNSGEPPMTSGYVSASPNGGAPLLPNGAEASVFSLSIN